jgi:L-ascorbate metabolism protein UlaG (beta-lactamase superfamily)
MVALRSILNGIAILLLTAVLSGTALAQRAEELGPGVTFRWLSNAGFELILPSGAHVLVDPWLDSANFPLPVASLERADYILLSHTHGDHSDDVGAIQRRFPDVRIFVGGLSAEPLVKLQNLDTSKIYKIIDDGQEFKFGEVTIQAFAGRHTEGMRGNYMSWDQNGEATSGSWGTFDMWSYLITLPNGIKFMVWGRSPSVDQAFKLEGLSPDLAAVHISPKQDFEVLGDMLRRMEPRVVMPHHYDAWPSILRRRPDEREQFPEEVQPVTPENVVAKTMAHVERALKANGMPAQYFMPEHHTWYRYDRSSGTITAENRTNAR